MSAKNLSHEQLAMYMTGKELTGKYKVLPGEKYYIRSKSSYNLRKETAKEVWSRKAKESEIHGLADSVKEIGVQEPVEILKNKYVADGYHRIASSPDQLIPIKHIESFRER